MASAPGSITAEEFKAAVDYYPTLIQSLSKEPKEGQLSLVDLDDFRYNGAPAAYSSKTGRQISVDDLQKLFEWKMKHGQFRPGLGKKVAANSQEQLDEATDDGFKHYAENPTDIKGVLEKLSKPLSGVGPATASLLLAIHDPSNIVFFSDELYRWLCQGSKKSSIKYDAKEFEDLNKKAQSFMERIKCTPIELEKAAFVIIREAEPEKEPATKKVPSGKQVGRPRKPDSEKKVYVPTGLPRGRKPKDGIAAKPRAPTGAKRGRPAKESSGEETVAKKGGRPSKSPAEGADTTAPKKRGRPSKSPAEYVSKSTPASKRRKVSEAPASSTQGGSKKAKA